MMKQLLLQGTLSLLLCYWVQVVVDASTQHGIHQLQHLPAFIDSSYSRIERHTLSSSTTTDDDDDDSPSSRQANFDKKSCGNISHSPRIIIAGAPASGKGTQSEAIRDALGVVHISTGDILRENIAKNTKLGTTAKGYMDRGELVPDELIIKIIKERLQEDDCKERGWLLDGFPRTRAQADALIDAGIDADCFLILNVSDKVAIDRVVGRRIDPVTGKIYHMSFNPPPQNDAALINRLVQRSDDTEEKARVRLRQFHSNIASVKSRYKKVMVKVDGTKSRDHISNQIKIELSKRCGWKNEQMRS